MTGWAAHFNVGVVVGARFITTDFIDVHVSGHINFTRIRHAVAVVVLKGAIIQIALVRDTIGVAVAAGLAVDVAAVGDAVAVAIGASSFTSITHTVAIAVGLIRV